ncbi:putative odorant receptor 85d [Nylanderia fulva]|uniref:putative odorant receptor 85d n=1 Tax=Nylanderia fulva TaxID=613905 RepID=UPI0010FAE252|nr:putative odorant receptor 85d [Nylanderia fulva]
MTQITQEDLDRASEVLSWNKHLMSTLGLWPFRNNNLLFFITFGYFSFLMMLEYLDLLLFINDLEHVVINLTENMAFSQILVRMIMLRLYNCQVGDVIAEVMKDFDKMCYKTTEEMKIVITYNARSKIFVKLLVVSVALTASSYFLTPIIIILGSGASCSCFYVILFCALGQTTADCIMVTLVFHICGQMSVLSMRITNINTELLSCRREMRHAVQMHLRLLRMGNTIEKAFNITLLAHLLGTISLVCILGYQILTNISKGDIGVLVPFVIFQFLVLITLYANCTVGENLLTESAKICEAFYKCHWYDMPMENARMIVLCMVRSQKPLCLTAGKFTIFCLSTLTDVRQKVLKCSK